MNNGRISRRFCELAAAGRAGLITFITAGDPNLPTSKAILAALPAAGADIIELGIPFSDPMADGPIIQASSLRALRQGQTLRRTLAMVADFRETNQTTPIVLMGYFNPIYVFGVEDFVKEAKRVGVDGVIVVDLPPEEADELRLPAEQIGLDLVFLVAPTTNDERLETILRHASGFVYYVSVLGITGTASAKVADVEHALAHIRRKTKLPVAVGFGIKTPAQAAEMARNADAAVVGSALVATIADQLDASDRPATDIVARVSELVKSISARMRAPDRKLVK